MSIRLKAFASLVIDQGRRGVRPYVALEHVEGGTGRLRVVEDQPLRAEADPGSVVVEPGDVLFGKLRPNLAKTWRADRPVYASTELMAIRPAPSTNSAWLGYLAASRPFIEWAVATADGSKMPRTSWEKVSDFQIRHLPGLSEQLAIADFLDQETARIDSLVAAKRRMVELVLQRFEAHAEANLFSSASRPIPLARLTPDDRQIMYGIVLPGPDLEAGVPIVKGGNVREGTVSGHLCMTSPEIEQGYARSRLRRDDLVIIIRGAGAGRVASVPSNADGANITQDVARIAARPGVDAGWLRLVLSSRPSQERLKLLVGGAAITGINIGDLKRLPVPMCSPVEQADLATAVAEAERRATATVSALTRQIELLVEHRQALITAAVTGELSVPGVAA